MEVDADAYPYGGVVAAPRAASADNANDAGDEACTPELTTEIEEQQAFEEGLFKCNCVDNPFTFRAIEYFKTNLTPLKHLKI